MQAPSAETSRVKFREDSEIAREQQEGREKWEANMWHHMRWPHSRDFHSYITQKRDKVLWRCVRAINLMGFRSNCQSEFILCDPRGYSVYVDINVTWVLVEVTLSFLVRWNQHSFITLHLSLMCRPKTCVSFGCLIVCIGLWVLLWLTWVSLTWL